MSTRREAPRTYAVQARDREPLIDFMVRALEGAGCRIIHRPAPDKAPFRITFETREGERMGILAYAFRANTKPTRNRPDDEHRFQVKYGPDDGKTHEIWQDPYGLYTTLFVGINPDLGIFVGADPVLHNPTRFFISIEFKQQHVDVIRKRGWHSWERDRRAEESPIEVLVGGTASQFLRYIRFERDAVGEDQGHRQMLADKRTPTRLLKSADVLAPPGVTRLHELAREFELTETEVLDLIASARRLKMAVRGWVAEKHLVTSLESVPGITRCVRSDEEGGPDVFVDFEGRRDITIECKNVLRTTMANGLVRLDFQRTRASQNDRCSRYYSARDFDVVAACLHAVSERWEFQFARSAELEPHEKCPGKLSHKVRLDERWNQPVQQVLRDVVNR